MKQWKQYNQGIGGEACWKRVTRYVLLFPSQHTDEFHKPPTKIRVSRLVLYHMVLKVRKNSTKSFFLSSSTLSKLFWCETIVRTMQSICKICWDLCALMISKWTWNTVELSQTVTHIVAIKFRNSIFSGRSQSWNYRTYRWTFTYVLRSRRRQSLHPSVKYETMREKKQQYNYSELNKHWISFSHSVTVGEWITQNANRSRAYMHTCACNISYECRQKTNGITKTKDREWRFYKMHYHALVFTNGKNEKLWEWFRYDWARSESTCFPLS